MDGGQVTRVRRTCIVNRRETEKLAGCFAGVADPALDAI
jgi:hypothetical protein